ncbi:hypothetical protein VNO77_13898 [Canavalia gladiata]|uniref:Uncharacterized protein n=1 Tax=Canavalia gladiata TaxID=3824 RepID=A0AAN9QV74_CANGL
MGTSHGLLGLADKCGQLCMARFQWIGKNFQNYAQHKEMQLMDLLSIFVEILFSYKFYHKNSQTQAKSADCKACICTLNLKAKPLLRSPLNLLPPTNPEFNEANPPSFES